jgi:hypothetical protein
MYTKVRKYACRLFAIPVCTNLTHSTHYKVYRRSLIWVLQSALDKDNRASPPIPVIFIESVIFMQTVLLFGEKCMYLRPCFDHLLYCLRTCFDYPSTLLRSLAVLSSYCDRASFALLGSIRTAYYHACMRVHVHVRTYDGQTVTFCPSYGVPTDSCYLY